MSVTKPGTPILEPAALDHLPAGSVITVPDGGQTGHTAYTRATDGAWYPPSTNPEDATDTKDVFLSDQLVQAVYDPGAFPPPTDLDGAPDPAWFAVAPTGQRVADLLTSLGIAADQTQQTWVRQAHLRYVSACATRWVQDLGGEYALPSALTDPSQAPAVMDHLDNLILLRTCTDLLFRLAQEESWQAGVSLREAAAVWETILPNVDHTGGW